MKIRSLVFGLCVSLFSTVFAANQHIHPQANEADKNATTQSAAKSKAGFPGYCEIEIINNSFDNVVVSGVFDDGTTLYPFNVYSFEAPHYISMYYYGYCHLGMNLYIDSWSGYNIYAGYTLTGSTIRIVPWLANKVKAEVRKK